MTSKSSTTMYDVRNPSPGEMLLEDFLVPMELSPSLLAKAIGVPARRINEILQGRRPITADTDLRMAKFFGLSDGFWLGVQADFDLLEQRRAIESELAQIQPIARAA